MEVVVVVGMEVMVVGGVEAEVGAWTPWRWCDSSQTGNFKQPHTYMWAAQTHKTQPDASLVLATEVGRHWSRPWRQRWRSHGVPRTDGGAAARSPQQQRQLGAWVDLWLTCPVHGADGNCNHGEPRDPAHRIHFDHHVRIT